MQKNASPTREQARALEKAGLSRVTWSIMKEMKQSLIIRHRITGEVRVISK